ncbi:cytochrome c biogenesis protein CcdA [Candidatus Latescibacterota bacterium]
MDFLTQTVSKYMSGGNPTAYFFVLAAGILTSFTPCVYPVIPIIVGYIGASQVRSRAKAFWLSVSYVLGMAVTFSILGIIASLTGMIFGRIQSSPWTHIFVGNVILFMALWFLDIISIPLPSFAAPRIKGKGFIPAFLLGMASGIIAAPCTAAVLVIILSYVGSRQNIFFGATILFTYAAGLGTVLIIAGTFTGFISTLMKSESLSVKVKKVFGIALILLSQYFFIQAGKLF